MPIIRIIAWSVVFLFFTCFWAEAQDAPPRLEVFAEGGGSFLHNGSGEIFVPVSCPPMICLPVQTSVASSFSNTGRLFTGGRFRFTRHDALEASYSYSPNRFPAQEGVEPVGTGYNRVDLISFNYVRYLGLGTHVQPFVTAGLGTVRFGGLFSGTLGWRFAGNYGGGADIVLQRHLALRLELRDYVTAQPASFVTGIIHNVVPSGGIVFRFR